MKTTHYKIFAPVRLTAAVLSDYHSSASHEHTMTDHVEGLLASIKKEHPDVIFAPGDTFNSITRKSVRDNTNISGFELLRGAAEIAPLYYSIGNHEQGISLENRAELERIGVKVLDNEFVRESNFLIGGFTSGLTFGCKYHRFFYKQPEPDISFIKEFSAHDGYKILLCHHPEYWEKYICGSGINVTVSGHAHGGQWGIPGGRGVYAPGQGLFPKYVRGIIKDCKGEELLAVSRGMTNTVPIPRFFNPCEIMILHFGDSAEL